MKFYPVSSLAELDENFENPAFQDFNIILGEQFE